MDRSSSVQKQHANVSDSQATLVDVQPSASHPLVSSCQPRHVHEETKDQCLQQTVQPKELKSVSYGMVICSNLRGVLESLVQELKDFCQMEIGIGYKRLHPLLLQLARFFQKDKDLIDQMTSFLLSNPDVLRSVMLVVDSTLKGLL